MKRHVLMGAVLALVLVGCTGGGKEGGGGFSSRRNEGQATNVFRYPIVTNPTTLDPGMVEDGDTIDLLQQVYEGLLTWSQDNQPVPLLADGMPEIQEGGKVYVFKIKKGVKFHNGQELTAEDFKWTYERNCDPKFPSPTALNYLKEIVGVEDRIAGKAKEISGITVVDPYTLRIEIDKPRPYFLGKLTYIVNAVLPKNSSTKEIRSAEEMVGTGPFRAERYVPDQITVLAANKEYHEGAPQVERIERQVMKDAQTRLNKYKSGEIDLVMLERQDVSGIQKDDRLKNELQFFPRAAIWYVGLAPVKYAPFKDARVRRAFAMAIDKNKIVNDYLGGVNQVANSIVPPGVLGHRENANDIKFNPAEAKKLLADAGFPNGKGMPPLELTFREQRPDIRIVAEAVSSMLKEHLNVDARLQTMEWRAFLEKRNRFDHQMVHMRWGADYLDPENFLSFMLATYPYGPENRIGYSNPKFDALCKEADATMDQERRLQLYAEAEDIVLQDAPWIPIYFQRDAELISPRVKGLRKSLFGHLPHKTVKIEG
jgi:oligopeptide transport system substrate-binding protein